MHNEPIGLEHRPLLRPLFKTLNLNISQYSFGVSYLYRMLDRGVKDVIFDEDIYLRGKTRSGKCFLTPTSPPDSIHWNRLKILSKEVDFVFPLPLEWVPHYELQGFKCTFDRGDSDYIFKQNKLAHYPGRKLQSKRNLAQQLLKEYPVQSRAFRTDDREAAQALVNTWQRASGQSDGETDVLPCLDALKGMDALGLDGRVSYIDGHLIGLVIGEPLSSDCYNLHFAKAERDFKGAYQYLFQDAAQSIAAGYSSINIEEDIGFANLRKSKMSYQPDLLRHKFRAH